MPSEENNADGFMLSPEPDITAYDLWRCMMMREKYYNNVRPEDVDSIPEDLRRHFKQRRVGQYMSDT